MSLGLWTPRPSEAPDPTNLFDMMLAFQTEIDSARTREDRLMKARFCVGAIQARLAPYFNDLGEMNVDAKLAIVDSVEDEGTGLVVADVGMHGQLETVQFTSIPPHIPGVLTLGLDVMSIYSKSSPGNTDLIMRGATVPIDQVDFIEVA